LRRRAGPLTVRNTNRPLKAPPASWTLRAAGQPLAILLAVASLQSAERVIRQQQKAIRESVVEPAGCVQCAIRLLSPARSSASSIRSAPRQFDRALPAGHSAANRAKVVVTTSRRGRKLNGRVAPITLGSRPWKPSVPLLARRVIVTALSPEIAPTPGTIGRWIWAR